MILTAYLDESGTHDKSVATVMGGILANSPQLQRFETKFRSAKREFGFHVFHTKKFKHKAGDFKAGAMRNAGR